jgi:uncharacterized protein (TIGR00369 family)
MTPEIEEKLRASFAAQSLMTTFEAKISALERGLCIIKAPIVAGARQQHGYAHAGMTFALGDSAAGYAALSQMPIEAEVLTVEMKINLLAPARGDGLIAEGRVEKAGRRLIVVCASVYARQGDFRTKVALLQGTMIPV